MCRGEQDMWLFDGQTIGLVCLLCAVSSLLAGSHTLWYLQFTLANLIAS